MKEKFEVTGYFYENQGHSFRKYLDIKIIGVNYSPSPDLVSVMMNPGSSRPVSGELNGRCDAETIPDATQLQLMRLMDRTGLHWVRLVNLCDLRESKSAILLEKIKELDRDGIDHSIFSSIDQIAALIPKELPVLLGWGVDSRLQDLATRACDLLSGHQIMGLQKINALWAYYHPLPQDWNKQQIWLDDISAQVESCISGSRQTAVS